MAKGITISEQKFSDIKLLISTGFSFKKAASIACVSVNTVRKVDGVDTYKAYIGEEEKENPPQGATVVSYHQLKALTEGVEKISSSLDDIYDLLHRYMEVGTEGKKDAVGSAD